LRSHVEHGRVLCFVSSYGSLMPSFFFPASSPSGTAPHPRCRSRRRRPGRGLLFVCRRRASAPRTRRTHDLGAAAKAFVLYMSTFRVPTGTACRSACRPRSASRLLQASSTWHSSDDGDVDRLHRAAAESDRSEASSRGPWTRFEPPCVISETISSDVPAVLTLTLARPGVLLERGDPVVVLVGLAALD